MADDFAEHLLTSSLAHMCKQQGWHQASRSGLSLFSDVARHYIRNIAVITLRYSLLGGRFEPDLDDLGNAFTELGLAIADLQSHWAETESNNQIPQVCSFPVTSALQLNVPDTVIAGRPEHVPEHLPSLLIKDESKVEEKTLKEDSTVLMETSSERAPDPFDEAAAAPAPTAPNFPFVNKNELPVPKMSSWGFQRITIDSKPSENSNSQSDSEKSSKPSASPENYVISENSDDFVYASKHTKLKEEKLKHTKLKEEKKPSPVKSTPPEPQTNHIPDSKPAPEHNTEPGLNVSLFMPSLGTSTPLVTAQKLALEKKEGQNGITCKQKLFGDVQKPANVTVIEEELSGFVPEKQKLVEPTIRVKTPEIGLPGTGSDTDDFNDFGFCGSSSDELPSKENLVKPLSPQVIIPEKPKSPIAPIIINNRSPPNKRRKLDKPISPPQPKDDKTLLKNRPDLIKNDIVIKTKPECKLVSNHHNSINKNSKHTNHVNKKHNDKLKNQPKSNDLPLKPKKVKAQGIENNHENHRTKKVKKKEPSITPIDLFEDSTIKLSNHKVDKLKKNNDTPEAISDQQSSNSRPNSATPPPVAEPAKPKIAPLMLSLPKKDHTRSEPKKTKLPSKAPTLPIPEQKSSLKISLKNLNNTKYKSKSIIDSEDDVSSLSSDSLDGFEDLLPKKSVKLKKSDQKVNKRMFKTKAELKNPWPSSSSPPPAPAVVENHHSPLPKEAEKKKTKLSVTTKPGITTKIKIGKAVVSSPSNSSLTSPKTSMKLKLPFPINESLSQEMNSSVYSQPSLRIDESLAEMPEEKPPIASLKIPKIKIKIGGSHLNDLNSPNNSPTPSYSSSTLTSPEPLKSTMSIKPLKIKLPDSSFLPKTEISGRPEDHVKRKKKSKKIKEHKQPKEPKHKPEVSIKEEVVIKEETPVIPESPVIVEPEHSLDNDDLIVPSTLESTLESETVLSETVVPGGGEAARIWYCPKCMLADDGSPMVGCDKCDEWYHWPCVGLVEAPPDNVDWFCPPCSKKRKPSKGSKPGPKPGTKTGSKPGPKPGTKRKRKT